MTSAAWKVLVLKSASARMHRMTSSKGIDLSSPMKLE